MAGDRNGWLALGAVAGLAVAHDFACAGAKGGAADPAVTDALEATLEAAGPEVIGPQLRLAREAAAALESPVRAWAEAGPADEAEARLQVQAGLLAAMAAWQAVEAMQVGPLGDALSVVGGEDLRTAIYSWPTVNPCRVDQETVAEGYADPAFATAALPNVRGLDALEWLAWAPPGENACPTQVDINAQGSWAALGAPEIQARRAAYALALVQGLVADLQRAEQAFGPEGAWSQALATAGAPGSPYDSPEAGLNALYDAAFYIESVAKDLKLAEPMGARTCTTDCAGLAEALPSGASGLALVENLRGFRALWEMGEGSGFDDLLLSLGQDALVDEIDAALGAAEAAAAALELPVHLALTDDPAALDALLQAMITLGRLWKLDVATALLLTVPADAAGDND